MQLSRPHLTILLNALYDTDTTRVTVAHPSDAVGDLLTIDLDDPTASTVRFETSLDDYADARRSVETEHGSPVANELPDPRSFVDALLAGGLLEPANQDGIVDFLDRNGNPDLTAGHTPVAAGFDANSSPGASPTSWT